MKRLVIFWCLVLFFYPDVFSQHIKGSYAIKNSETGMLLRIRDANKKDGTPLVAYAPVSWKCMTWDFYHLGGQNYRLKNLFTGKTFQPVSATEGSSLEQRPLHDSSGTQEYQFIPVKENMYLIKLKDTELYVTPADKDGTTNSGIILSKKKNSRLQEWIIYEQHPEF